MTVPFQTQLTAKSTENDINTWAPTTYVEDSDGFLGFGLAQAWPFVE